MSEWLLRFAIFLQGHESRESRKNIYLGMIEVDVFTNIKEYLYCYHDGYGV